MLRIDAHQHFWIFNPVRDHWINDDMKKLQRDFLPADLQPELLNNRMDGTIVIQANQSTEENAFLLELAGRFDFIKGVVGWVDLQAENVEEQLHLLSRFNKLKGFRHVLQSEPDEAFMLRPAFQRGIGMLQKHRFTYDILIYPQHLRYAIELVANFPNQPFVIDHLAKPYIKDNNIAGWKKDMETIAGYPHVCCKVSGMVTEASWNHWSRDQFIPYLDTVFAAFGTKRVLFGSDWPVCLLAASYDQVLAIVEDYLAGLSTDEKDACLGGNALRFYQID